MLPVATVAHSLQGRTRFRIPSQKGNDDFFRTAEQVLGDHPQISYLETNVQTGSILIYHRNELAALQHLVQEQELFTTQAPTPTPERALASTSDRLDQLDRLLRRITRGAFNLDELLFVTLIGAALVQAVRGRVMAPATTLLSYAATLLALHRANRKPE